MVEPRLFDQIAELATSNTRRRAKHPSRDFRESHHADLSSGKTGPDVGKFIVARSSPSPSYVARTRPAASHPMIRSWLPADEVDAREKASLAELPADPRVIAAVAGRKCKVEGTSGSWSSAA